MRCRAVCLLLLFCLTGSFAQQLCTLITSSVLHADTEETIVLDGHSSTFTADFTVMDFPLQKTSLAHGKISVNSGNKFLGTAKIKIPAQDLQKDPKRKQYVTIFIKSPTCTMEKNILLSYYSGYIFIQTDKTIYTPGSRVLFRIFPVNYKMQPAKQTVTVQIQNTEGIVVRKEPLFPDASGIISKSHELSDLASLGIWTISARYDNTLQEFTTNFEVKEYVLPNIEVTIKTDKNFMYLEDETFSVTVQAQYTYGKPVSGKAFVLFGIKKDDIKKSLTDSLRRIEVTERGERATLMRNDLIKDFKNADDLLQYRLYVSVTVITDSGSDMVEAELDDIYIVKSPYQIVFTRTTKFFKPGMPFHLMVTVTNPDGSPAGNIPVEMVPGNVKGVTHQDGTAKLILNTGTNENSLKATVKTTVTTLLANQQASGKTSANAYTSVSGQGNYLHISIGSNILEHGDQVFINFNMNGNVAAQRNIQHITYLILSKGRIMKVGRQNREQGQQLITMSLFITEEFIPSIRIVAYYTIGNEIVSDSLWVDVADKCMGTLELNADKTIVKPGKSIKLTLKADHNSNVALVAVDKGVFVLNNKYKMTQSKVWDIVEKTDIGCTPGSGANNMGVFYDAGLAVQTNFGTTTTQRSDPSCEASKKRRRRSSAALIEYKAKKALNYEALEKQCCSDGMVTNPMGYSCERRARLIQDGEKCVEAFLECCRAIELKLKIEKELKDNNDLDRSDSDENYLPDSEIEVRSKFPESWLWNIVKMKEAPDANNISTHEMKNIFLKDSITTWEVLAVSLSENKGICVAPPCEIVAFKDFFIDLRLPYSVMRNEQVEIRAIIYNYIDEELRVRVSLSYNEKFCSLSTPSKKYTQEVKVKPNSSFAVPFIIVPLFVGELDVEAKASVFGELGWDGIMKPLKVVPEGVRKTEILTSVTLEPETRGRSGEQIVNVRSLTNKNIVPKSETRIIINVQGNPVAQLVEDSIDGSNLHHLIIVPSGCAEQNMMRMTPVVIVIYYLDRTNQWERIGLHRREEAIRNVHRGYVNQLSHRSKDGSYGAFPGSNSGTWLTAYVAKVFAMANDVTDIDKSILCGSIKWLLLERQKPDGMFQEDIPISGQYMKGGLGGSLDPDVAITSFVVITLLESQKICSAHVNNLHQSIDKATNYISERYYSLRHPHSIAITSYALALAGKLQDSNKLLSAATDKTHWNVPGSRLISLEATSYALLTLLYLEDYELIDPVVVWLSEQRFFGEKYGSTQATIMVFQALAEYQVKKANIKVLNMDVSFQLPERRDPINYRINLENSLQARSDETKINKDFVVKAKGKGQATLTVMAVYYEIVTEKDKECSNFDLSVTVKDEPHAPRPDGALKTISMTICFRHRKSVDATMSILDVSMMTGFSPDVEGLKKLRKGVDRFISDFEINKGAFDKGTLIIYLNKISHTEEECLKFNAHQYFNVGLIQPGSVTVYDYYTPESRCTKFYHKDEGDSLLGRLCQGEVCQCSEGNCLMKHHEKQHTAFDRMTKACEAGMDYVYKVNLLEAQYEKDYDRYVMQINKVFKIGSDEDARGNKRTFISHIKCREKLKFNKGHDYIVYGTTKDVWQTETFGYTYIIGSETWIEWWPNNRECQLPEHDQLCDTLSVVSEELETFGCQN
ncbi:venom factor-like [Mixophyes fleayi]|uniref:venom factor-like n=1 Tax=Mixophyes fleayi TaxID=3061075 RepID=UPI003F4DD955